MLAATLSFQLILLIGIGIFSWKAGIVGGNFDKQLSSFLLNLALPCLIIKSMNVPFSRDELRSGALLVVLSVAVYAVSLLLGQLCYFISGKNGTGRILRFGMVFTNFTFMGIPVVETLYGQQGLFYFVIFLVPLRMVYYASAKPLLSPPGTALEHQGAFQRLKGYFSPPVTAIFIGLFLYITGLQLPTVLSQVISSVGSICSPLGMVLCGMSMGKYDFKLLLHPRYLRLPLMRNLVMPAVFFFLTRLLPLDPLLSDIVVIYAALPVASLLAVFTVEYDPASQFESAGGTLLSTLLSAVTIPFWVYMLSL